MKKKSRLLAILLGVLLLTTSFASCGQRAVNDDDQSTPEATSTSTPERTPEASPEATPEATPKATPETTPETTPEATPEATLEATPESIPEATPKATPEASDEVDTDKAFGVIDGNLYTNELFKFTVMFPDDWHTANREQLLNINQLGADLIKESGGNNSAIDLAMTQIIPLFFVSQHPLDYIGGTNANMNALAQNLGISKSLINGPKHYLKLVPQSMKAQGLDYAMGEIAELKIGGLDFGKVDAVLTFQGAEITQTMYVTLVDDYAITFTLTYFSDEERKQLEDIINTFSFK